LPRPDRARAAAFTGPGAPPTEGPRGLNPAVRCISVAFSFNVSFSPCILVVSGASHRPAGRARRGLAPSKTALTHPPAPMAEAPVPFCHGLTDAGATSPRVCCDFHDPLVRRSRPFLTGAGSQVRSGGTYRSDCAWPATTFPVPAAADIRERRAQGSALVARSAASAGGEGARPTRANADTWSFNAHERNE